MERWHDFGGWLKASLVNGMIFSEDLLCSRHHTKLGESSSNQVQSPVETPVTEGLTAHHSKLWHSQTSATLPPLEHLRWKENGQGRLSSDAAPSLRPKAKRREKMRNKFCRKSQV
jgi:hypothetical protein